MRLRSVTVLASLAAFLPATVLAQREGVSQGDPVGTFSILAYDAESGEIGGAVQSRVFSVGNGVLWGEAGVGMVATQAIVDVSYGPQALELLRQGHSPDDVVRRVWEADPDPRPERWSKYGRSILAPEPTNGRVTRSLDTLRHRATFSRARPPSPIWSPPSMKRRAICPFASLQRSKQVTRPGVTPEGCNLPQC
jgi:hypothetical protein